MKSNAYWQRCSAYWGSRAFAPKWYDTLWLVPLMILATIYRLLQMLVTYVWRK